MIGWLLSVTGLSRLWLYVAAAAAIAGAVLLILARTKEAGRQAERIDAAMQTLKVKDAQLKAAAAAPRDPAGAARRMRDGTF